MIQYIFKTFLILFFGLIFSTLSAQAQRVCVKELSSSSSLNLRAGPGTRHAVVGLIPSDSCRISVDTENCQGSWCKAVRGCTSGWVSKRHIDIKYSSTHFNDYWMMRSICDVVSKRSERGYHLTRTYSQNLDYGQTTELKSFYYKRGSGWQFPGGEEPTMCVAAVAEVAVEALNLYAQEAGDYSPFELLSADHWSYKGGQPKRLRAHLWEFSDPPLESKGAAHAFERFNIGKQLKFSELQPGDLFKFSRSEGPGHSTVFIAYLDLTGEVLEKYSDKVVGVRYFSAQVKAGFDYDGNALSAGLGYRDEYFYGNCPSAGGYSERNHCAMLPFSSRYRPNVGAMLHPKNWGAIGSNYRAEIRNREYINLTGRPIPEDEQVFVGSTDSQQRTLLDFNVEEFLDRNVSLNSVGNFGQ